jgi:hypothetical protein
MPLKMKGIISYLPMRKPTNNEIANSPRLIMTSDMPWEPHSQDFAQAEQLAMQQACALLTITQQLSLRNEDRASPMTSWNVHNILTKLGILQLAALPMTIYFTTGYLQPTISTTRPPGTFLRGPCKSQSKMEPERFIVASEPQIVRLESAAKIV